MSKSEKKYKEYKKELKAFLIRINNIWTGKNMHLHFFPLFTQA